MAKKITNEQKFIMPQGLSDSEVMERLTRDGYNELPTAKKGAFWHILVDILQESMFLILIAAGTLYLVLGDLIEALILLSSITFVIVIAIFQKQKTERALEALRDLSSPRAHVIRNNERQRIAGREVVPDDIIIISEGDRVPADAVLLSATNVNVDESLLTGESVPVRKQIWDGSQKIGRPGGDDLSFVYSGTLVVKGQGIAKVLSTGQHTEIGKIGKALQILKPEDTNLQKQVDKIVKIFAFIGLCLCVIVVVAYGLTRGHWLAGFLAGLTLAMSILPEEFPVVMTIFLALGAWRISKRKVLTRRIPAVEMLGAATVLCVDKTGTITLNKMTVTKAYIEGHTYDINETETKLNENLYRLIEFSILASPDNPFDPMEQAIKKIGERFMTKSQIKQERSMIKEYPLTDKRLAITRVWKFSDKKEYIIAVKGAPETIFELCHLDPEHIKSIKLHVDHLSETGLRIIGVAKAHFRPGKLPLELNSFNFEFLGLLGLSDPVRPEVPQAVAECYSAGIRIIMITGDYPGTAANIAGQIGLKPCNLIITGHELDQMDDVELQRRIQSVCIFARVVPEQKLRIVNALKLNKEVVVMTGDGVNDAPALKAAHIGIAMGARGTDVAREAASMVLLDDNFASIVAAVKTGRRIFDNLKKAVSYLFSVHIPIAGMALIPVIFKWPLALFPLHMVFFELIIDPACSIVFEAESDENDLMKRKPRPLTEPLFNRRMFFTGLTQGLGILAITAGIYVSAFMVGLTDDEARTFAFINLIIANLGLIFINRSWSKSIINTFKAKNSALWWVCGGSLSLLALILLAPPLRSIFSLAPLHFIDVLVISAIGLLSIILSASVKLPYFKHFINYVSK